MIEEADKNNKKFEKVKIVVLGAISVGKTCLISRYITGKFLYEIPATCGTNFVEKKKIINNKKYILNIWDTAGQERFGSLTKLFTKNAQIAIIVYSIIDKQSFEDLNKWLELIKETNHNDLIIGIAANKSDLYLQSVIPDEKGQEYAKKIDAVWKSTSALVDDHGIDLLVDELIKRYSERAIDPEYNHLMENSFSISEDYIKIKKGDCCTGICSHKPSRETIKSLTKSEFRSESNYSGSQRITCLSNSNLNITNDEEDL